MWSRVVWREGSKEVEDVILSKWVCGKKVLWPKKAAMTAMKRQLSPDADWLKYPLIKVKMSSGKMLSIELGRVKILIRFFLRAISLG